MKVLMVSDHCCMRVLKQGIALVKNGIQPIYMFKRLSQPTFTPAMLYASQYYTVEDFTQKLQNFSDIDIIHCHNEPDWFGHIAKQVRPDLPVIFDAHDLFSARINQMLPDEKKSFKDCDAFVYPSRAYKDHCLSVHRDVGVGKKPNIVVYSLPNEDFVTETPLPRVDACVYEGGLRIKETEGEEKYKYHEYRDYNKPFKFLSDRGIPIVAFAANRDAVVHHANNGALVIPPLEYSQLIPNLSRFRWGLAGGPMDHPQWNMAMPHKLFEYIAAGIPVLTFNATEVAEFVTRHEIGVALDTWEDIPKVYADSEKYRKNVWWLQNYFTMEHHIQPLIKLYKELV